MGFLARLSLRSRPAQARAPVLMPKGIAMRQPIFRAAEEEPAEEAEQAQPLRRTLRRAAAPPPDDEEVPRAAAPEPEDKDEAQPAMARRAEKPTADEGEDEERAQPLRRATQPDKETDEKEPPPAARLIRRAEEVPVEGGEKPLRQPFQSDLSPGASPLPPDMASEEEPSPVQALRRDVSMPALAPRDSGRAAPSVVDFDAGGSDRPAPIPVPFGSDDTAAGGAGSWFDAGFSREGMAARGEGRPQVIIDQVDVLIHEPASQAAGSRPAFDSARAMRARYLRRM